jgi:hypothetical protein
VRLAENRLLLLPSDLTGYLACPHLATLSLAVARGELTRPHRHNPHADLIGRKGDEHEARYLAALRDAGKARGSASKAVTRRKARPNRVI